jgi:hypothetical protein
MLDNWRTTLNQSETRLQALLCLDNRQLECATYVETVFSMNLDPSMSNQQCGCAAVCEQTLYHYDVLKKCVADVTTFAPVRGAFFANAPIPSGPHNCRVDQSLADP